MHAKEFKPHCDVLAEKSFSLVPAQKRKLLSLSEVQ